jgi:hypothetical protein
VPFAADEGSGFKMYPNALLRVSFIPSFLPDKPSGPVSPLTSYVSTLTSDEFMSLM